MIPTKDKYQTHTDLLNSKIESKHSRKAKKSKGSISGSKLAQGIVPVILVTWIALVFFNGNPLIRETLASIIIIACLLFFKIASGSKK